MFAFLRWFVKSRVFNFVLLVHPVIAHLLIPRVMPAHSQYLSILSSCGEMESSFENIAAKSSAYAAKFIVLFEVLNFYP